MDFYDVAVCGAGPAGAAFAMTAPKDMKILLLYGSYAPKPCGACLPPMRKKHLQALNSLCPKMFLLTRRFFPFAQSI